MELSQREVLKLIEENIEDFSYEEVARIHHAICAEMTKRGQDNKPWVSTLEPGAKVLVTCNSGVLPGFVIEKVKISRAFVNYRGPNGDWPNDSRHEVPLSAIISEDPVYESARKRRELERRGFQNSELLERSENAW